MNTGLDQYMDIFKDAVEDSAAKLTKSFEKILIEVIILFMVNREDGLLPLIPVTSAKLARRNDSSLQTPQFRVKRYFFIIEPGSRSNFAFVTPKAILVLWTARLAISGNSILLSMLRSHH